MMNALDDEILEYIRRYQSQPENALAPDLGQIRQATRTTSRGVCTALSRLVACGKIEIKKDNVNGLQIEVK